MIAQRETELMGMAQDAFKKRDFKKATSIFQDVLGINKRNTEAYFYLGNIFYTNGEFGKAINAFKKVLELDPAHTDASISLSILYNDIGRYDEAKAIFNSANERVKSKRSSVGLEDRHINKKFALKHFEIADLYFTYSRYDEALFEYKKASALDPDNLDIKIKIAKVYAKKGFLSKAFEELRKLKNENPGHLPTRIALGILHYSTGHILEAQTEWQGVLAKDPTHQDAKMYLNLSKTATETSVEHLR